MSAELQNQRVESSYEKLLKKFQSYAFGSNQAEIIEVRDVSIKRPIQYNDSLLELKENVQKLEELSHRLKYMMTEINSLVQRNI